MLKQGHAMQSESQADVQNQSERIIYLAPDCTDSAVKKRVHGFMGLGHKLTSYSFRRDRYNVGSRTDWPNIELGKSQERQLVARVAMVLRAVWIILRDRQTWQDATVIYARNLDLALLALVGKAFARSRATFAFEVLDIHPMLTTRGLRGAILRWIERRVLKRCDLLVVSSPAYIREYFQVWQDFRGKTFLLENKWSDKSHFHGKRRLGYELPDEQTGKPPWRIGWFGNLRCQKSLEMLCQLAAELPDHVFVYMRGCASLLGAGVLQKAIGGRSNMLFAGEYSAPDELPEVYADVHFNWCGDFSDGDNSLWLLPNRIYEGGYFGVPALAAVGYETGRVVQERRLGVALEAPYLASLKHLLLHLSREEYTRMREDIESRPSEEFLDTCDLGRLMRALATPT